MSYSQKISDPRFDRYLKNTRDYRYQFAFLLALVAVIAFYIYGETSDEMDNPEALYIGLGIGGMFMLIGLYAAFSGSRQTLDWDAVVAEKGIVHKNGKPNYIVFFEDANGNRREIRSEEDMTLYEYFRIGEKVRYHGKLKTYEKFDKSQDDIIFCNACSFMHEMEDTICRNCGCPLLK